jgi:hypothetical protein
MSYTEIYRITKKGNTVLAGEIRNAHRGAMAVWTFLEDKYLPPNIKYGQKMTRMIGDAQEVWDLAKDTRLTDGERICLLSTFDNVLVLKEDVFRLTKAFREFTGITSLSEQADVIEKAATHKNCYGVCWNQTSVNADIPEKNITGKYWSLFDHEFLKPITA